MCEAVDAASLLQQAVGLLAHVGRGSESFARFHVSLHRCRWGYGESSPMAHGSNKLPPGYFAGTPCYPYEVAITSIVERTPTPLFSALAFQLGSTAAQDHVFDVVVKKRSWP